MLFYTIIQIVYLTNVLSSNWHSKPNYMFINHKEHDLNITCSIRNMLTCDLTIDIIISHGRTRITHGDDCVSDLR